LWEIDHIYNLGAVVDEMNYLDFKVKRSEGQGQGPGQTRL